MATVTLSGLPNNAKVPRFVFLFKSIFKQKMIRSKFWITALGDMPEAPLKEMTIEFDSEGDAFEAQEMLDNYSYFDKSTKETFILSAEVNVKSVVHNIERPQRPESRRGDRHWEMTSRGRGLQKSKRNRHSSHSRERYRSRSPINRKSSDLDLELELLRKQRMVIEEERRLLLERKKLELIQEYGPSAVTEFDTDFVQPRISPPRRRQEPMPKPRPERVKGYKQKSQGFIPKFVLPCKLLTEEMKTLIDTYAEKTDKYMLKNLIALNIRKRLAVALENKKKYLYSKDIVKLYRSLYPKTTDETLVKMAARNIEQSHMLEFQNTEQKDQVQDGEERESSLENWEEDDTNKATSSDTCNLANENIQADLDITMKPVDHENDESNSVENKTDITATDGNEMSGEKEKSVTEDVEIEADTTKADEETIKKAKNAKLDPNEDVSKPAGEIEFTEPDVSSSVVDEELKLCSDDLEDENFDNEDVEDWVEGGEDWTDN